jgi:parallel beta-helix repeat protein
MQNRLITTWLSGLLLISHTAQSETYYLSSSGGNDANDGLSESSAWQSLDKLNTTKLPDDTTLRFKRGDVFRGSININASNARINGISANAYGTGPKPVISGSIAITDWQPTTHPQLSPQVWEATVPTTEAIIHLFVDGELMTIARYPNADSPASDHDWLNVDESAGMDSFTDTDLVSDKPDDYWVGATLRLRNFSWTYTVLPITGYQSASGKITAAGLGNQRPGWGYFLDGKLEELDYPSEWYYDAITQKVYLYPPNGQDPNELLVEGSVYQNGWRGSGQGSVTIANLVFQHFNGNGISIGGQEPIIIHDCDFKHNKTGLSWWNAANIIVSDNSFDHQLTTALVLKHDITNFTVQQAIIENNTITHTAMYPGYGKRLEGIYEGSAIKVSGQGYILRQNVIDYSSWVGIAVGKGGGHTVENNVIRHTLALLNDGGGIFIGSNNNIIRGNFISDTIGNIGDSEGCFEGNDPCYHLPSFGMGIGSDPGFKNNFIENNTVYNNNDNGIRLNQFTNTTVRNNVLYNNERAQIFFDKDPSANNVIDNNIMYSLGPNQVGLLFPPVNEGKSNYFDNNYYCNPYREIVFNPSASLAWWQQQHPTLEVHSRQCGERFDYAITNTNPTEAVLNATFDDEESTWGRDNHEPNPVGLDGGSLKATLTAKSQKIISPRFPLVAGQRYLLRFSIIANGFGVVPVSINDKPQGVPPQILQKNTFAYSPERLEHQMLLTELPTTENGMIVFSVKSEAGGADTVWLDNVVVEPIEAGNWNDATQRAKLFTNPTADPKTIPLDTTYRDVKGQLVSNSLTLAPFTSQILVVASGSLPSSSSSSSPPPPTTNPSVPPPPSEHLLTVRINGSGKGKVKSHPRGIDDCSIGSCTTNFPWGKKVILLARAAAGSVFSDWSGACSGTESTTTVAMNADKDCTANFDSSSITYTLTINKQGEGVVTNDLQGIHCGNTCAKDYPIGTVVKLTTTLTGQSDSFSWAGDEDCQDGEVTLNTDVNCKVTFSKPPTQVLQIHKSGDGDGTVTDANNLLNCGTSCTQTYLSGSTVELKAIAESNSEFVGLSGENCTDSFIIAADMNCTAAFKLKDIKNIKFQDIKKPPIPQPPIPQNYPLTIQLSGSDHGKVQSNLGGIDCKPQCTESYLAGTAVTLTALPAEDFIGWEEDCQAATENTAVVMMNAVKNCTAKFAPTKYSLTLIKQGEGDIIIQPNNPPCGDSCFVSYPRGSVVTLQPVVKGNTRLVAFKGDPDCQDGQITLDKDIQCEAVFEPLKSFEAPPCPLNGIIDYVCNGEGKAITDVTIETTGQVSNVKLIGQAINRGRFYNATIESSGILIGGIVSGYIINHGTMQDFDFRGETISGGNLAGSIVSTGTLEDVHLKANTHISGGKLANNVSGEAEGLALLDNLEIQPGTHLSQVIIGDNVKLLQPVVLTDIEFRGKILQGATLSGVIKNSKHSTLEDVQFQGDTLVIGGKLGGKIQGNHSQQIQLEQLEILPGSELSQVLIGPNVIFPKDVILKEGIQFTDAQAIPPELELSKILPTLWGPNGCVIRFIQPDLFDLTASLFPDKPSILEMINEIPDVQERGWQLTQDEQYGYLKQVEPDNSWIALQPWSIKRTNIETAQMQVNEQQTTMFITKTGLEILTQPAVQAPCELQDALEKLIPKLNFPVFIMQPNGNVTVPISATLEYSARPEWVSKEMTDSSPIGINILPSPLITGTFIIQQVFSEPYDNKRREQLFYPAVAIPEELYLAAEKITIEFDGVVTFTLADQDYHGVIDYAVTKDIDYAMTKGKVITNTLEISTLPDSNGDGQADWLILDPTGEQQKIFALPTNK